MNARFYLSYVIQTAFHCLFLPQKIKIQPLVYTVLSLRNITQYIKVICIYLIHKYINVNITASSDLF